MKLCAVVVTYYPNVSDAIKNILQYIHYIDHLIIWENTPQKDNAKYKISIPAYENKISYMGLQKNVGISKALNEATKYALTHGYTHLLTMDQDSEWHKFNCFKQSIPEHETAIFGPILGRFSVHKTDEHALRTEVDHVITSGTIVPLSVLERIGGYNEAFKIDGIDVELCYRAQTYNIKTFTLSTGYILQQFGNAESRQFLSKTFTPFNYGPLRIQGIIKNHLLIWRSYNISTIRKKHILQNYLIRFPVNIILFEKQKFKKLCAYVSGIFQGLINPKLDITSIAKSTRKG